MSYNYVPDDMWKKLALDFAKRWLSHDGLWFQAVERRFGIDEAIALDVNAWEKYTVLEAKRIMSLLKIEEGEGLESLEQCLKYRMYAFLNEQEIIRPDEKTLIFRMNKCRVQFTRKRKAMELFKCKPAGLVEYSMFASTVDKRIETRCIGCPPDEVPSDKWYCAWEFIIK